MKNVLALVGLQGEQPVLKQRLLLYSDELYRVPADCQQLRVTEGVAFVTQAAQDMILSPGQEVALQSSFDHALVSVVRGDHVVVELYKCPERRLPTAWWWQNARAHHLVGALQSANNGRERMVDHP
jgi:hypothetical protein